MSHRGLSFVLFSLYTPLTIQLLKISFRIMLYLKKKIDLGLNSVVTMSCNSLCSFLCNDHTVIAFMVNFPLAQNYRMKIN